MRSNRVALLKVLSKREQSHACMFYAEREGLRPERSKSKQNYNKSTELTEEDDKSTDGTASGEPCLHEFSRGRDTRLTFLPPLYMPPYRGLLYEGSQGAGFK